MVSGLRALLACASRFWLRLQRGACGGRKADGQAASDVLLTRRLRAAAGRHAGAGYCCSLTLLPGSSQPSVGANDLWRGRGLIYLHNRCSQPAYTVYICWPPPSFYPALPTSAKRTRVFGAGRFMPAPAFYCAHMRFLPLSRLKGATCNTGGRALNSVTWWNGNLALLPADVGGRGRSSAAEPARACLQPPLKVGACAFSLSAVLLRDGDAPPSPLRLTRPSRGCWRFHDAQDSDERGTTL